MNPLYNIKIAVIKSTNRLGPDEYCDMYTHCQVTTTQTGDSKTAVVREQFCGQFSSPAMTEYAIMEETFSVRSAPGLYNEY
jgi:hypothetical protein